MKNDWEHALIWIRWGVVLFVMVLMFDRLDAILGLLQEAAKVR
jgi:hypothetical protein